MCIYFKVRTKKGKRYFYCTLKRETITYDECKSCGDKEYKRYKPIKKRTYKQTKREKGRYSIIADDLSKCVVCGITTGINKHEVFYGKNRQNSINYKFIIPLCQKHHTGKNGIHFNNELNLFYKRLCQKKFEEEYGTRNDFIKIFGRNYLDE